MEVSFVRKTECVELKFRSDGIVEIHTLPEMTRIFELEDMAAIIAILLENLDKYPSLVIYITNGKYTAEARRHITEHEPLLDKIAMVANKPMQTLVGNFFLGINKPKAQIRLFNTGEKAIKWLKA